MIYTTNDRLLLRTSFWIVCNIQLFMQISMVIVFVVIYGIIHLIYLCFIRSRPHMSTKLLYYQFGALVTIPWGDSTPIRASSFEPPLPPRRICPWKASRTAELDTIECEDGTIRSDWKCVPWIERKNNAMEYQLAPRQF